MLTEERSFQKKSRAHEMHWTKKYKVEDPSSLPKLLNQNHLPVVGMAFQYKYLTSNCR